MRRPGWKTVLLLLLGIVLAVLLGAYAVHRYEYPHGRTHRCTILLSLELHGYAETHEGKFPAGEATPEASLSLLYRANQYDELPDVLAGRAKSGKVARKILESGGLLGPDTCDWHYVEGLTWDDDGDIAILWDKSSLGHRGQNLHGGHEVLRLGHIPEVIAEDKWDAFLAEQRELHSRRSQWAKEGRPILSARVQMPDGTLVDSPDTGVDLEYDTPTGRGCGFSGSYQYSSRLCWYYPHSENDTVKYRVSFSGLRSEPLTVEWHNSQPDRPTIIFKMK